MNKIGILQGRLTSSNGRGTQFFPTENWQNEFALAKKIGFDCIEWLIKDTKPEENPLFSQAGIEEINRLRVEHGIDIPSVHGFYRKDDAFQDIAVTLVRNTAAIGAKTILISFFHDKALLTLEDKQKAVEQLRPALREAEKLGVRLGVETEIAAPELLEFITMFQSPAIGIYYDIGNMVSMNVNVEDEIRLIGTRIFGVHVKDRKRDGGESYPFGEGDSDFPSIFRVLQNIGYTGAYVFQGARSEGVDDIVLNQRYYDYIQTILKDL